MFFLVGEIAELDALERVLGAVNEPLDLVDAAVGSLAELLQHLEFLDGHGWYIILPAATPAGLLWNIMIQQKLVEVLAAVPPHHPIFFFMQLFSAHYVGELPFALPLMVLALLGVFAVRKNYFWYAGIAVCPGLGPVALVNIAVGLLSLDEVWKLPLYLYVIGDLYLRSVGAAWQFYNFLALLALLAWIYRELPFNNPNENRLYFGGFGGLWFSHFTIFISSTLDVTPDRWYFPVLLTCFAMGCSFYIIGIRMDRIFNMKLEEIESASQYLLYVRHIQLQLQEPFEQIGMERAHR